MCQFAFEFIIRKHSNENRIRKSSIPIIKDIKERDVDLRIDKQLILNSNHLLNSTKSRLPFIFVGGFARSGTTLMVNFIFSKKLIF